MNILIADSGSTKTDWRLVVGNGVVYALTTDGFNPYYQTTEQIRALLQAQLLPQLAGAVVDRVFFYGAGCTGPAVNPTVAAAIRLVLPAAVSIEVDSDMLGAARAAAGNDPGIVCILGTGSNACCYDGTNIIRGIQSLGFWLGDEGSGGYLGKTLVRDFFQDRLPADLHAAFEARYAPDRLTVLDNAYKKPFPNRYFASFTPFLSENIAHPHVVEAVTQAFSLFLTIYVRRFPESDRWPVHAVGSVAHYFADFWQEAIERVGLVPGQRLKAPAERLVEYHQRHG